MLSRKLSFRIISARDQLFQSSSQHQRLQMASSCISYQLCRMSNQVPFGYLWDRPSTQKFNAWLKLSMNDIIPVQITQFSIRIATFSTFWTHSPFLGMICPAVAIFLGALLNYFCCRGNICVCLSVCMHVCICSMEKVRGPTSYQAKRYVR